MAVSVLSGFKFEFRAESIPVFNKRMFNKMNEDLGLDAMEKATLVAQSKIRHEAPRGHSLALINSIATKVKPFEGEVYTKLKYAPVQEYGRKKAFAPIDPLARWVRLSPVGQKYLADLQRAYPKIGMRKGRYSKTRAAKTAAFILSRAMKNKERKGKYFFKKGVEKAWPDIEKIFTEMHTKIAHRSLWG